MQSKRVPEKLGLEEKFSSFTKSFLQVTETITRKCSIKKVAIKNYFTVPLLQST